jgi:hypothetical protein
MRSGYLLYLLAHSGPGGLTNVTKANSSIALAAAAVVGTIGLSTVVVYQWTLPTLTASLSHKIALLEERLSVETEATAELMAHNEALAARMIRERDDHRQQIAQLQDENNNLGRRLFESQIATLFLPGSPYPVGLDIVRIGDPDDKVLEVYAQGDVSAVGKRLVVDGQGDIFLRLVYTHSYSDRTVGLIDSIQYDLANYQRIGNDTLPDIPEGWLEDTLRRTLGEPYIVGVEAECLMWNVKGVGLVYYLGGADRFMISDYVSFPPGCDISEEQMERIEAAQAQEEEY